MKNIWFYSSILCLTGKNALKTELQFSDMYCLMAAHVYIDLWKETGEFFLLLFQICLRFGVVFVSHRVSLGSVCRRGREHGVAGFGRPAGGSVSQRLQRPVQAAAAAPLLSPGSLRACGGPLLQPGCQARTARHHRVSTYTVKRFYFRLYCDR